MLTQNVQKLTGLSPVDYDVFKAQKQSGELVTADGKKYNVVFTEGSGYGVTRAARDGMNCTTGLADFFRRAFEGSLSTRKMQIQNDLNSGKLHWFKNQTEVTAAVVQIAFPLAGRFTLSAQLMTLIESQKSKAEARKMGQQASVEMSVQKQWLPTSLDSISMEPTQISQDPVEPDNAERTQVKNAGKNISGKKLARIIQTDPQADPDFKLAYTFRKID